VSSWTLTPHRHSPESRHTRVPLAAAVRTHRSARPGPVAYTVLRSGHWRVESVERVLYAPRRKRSARLLPLFHTTRQKDYYVRHCAHGRYGSHNHTSHITQPPGRGVHISRLQGPSARPRRTSRDDARATAYTRACLATPPDRTVRRCVHTRDATIDQHANTTCDHAHHSAGSASERDAKPVSRRQPHRRPPRSQQHMITPWKTREQSIATQAHGRALTPLTS
jgi:hypothetical protein